MIIRGNPAGNVMFWSKHLTNDEKNERAEVREIRGCTADNLQDALWEMKWVAAGSRCQGNFMYQANINPYAHETLTPDQWRESIDTLEKNLGLDGHQRIVIEHVKHGRQHFHVVWNRVDQETLRVADMGGNWRIHERTQEELEQRFGLTPTPAKDPDRARGPDLWELRAAERSGIDPVAMKAELTELWRASDTGQAFKAAIEERGYILANGDKASVLGVVDYAGDFHSLTRRLDGVKAAEVRDFMQHVDRGALPSVDEARAEQRARSDSITYDQQPAFETAAAEVAAPVPAGAVRETDEAEWDVGAAPLMVMDAVAGTLSKLADFVTDFLCGGGGEKQQSPDLVQRIIEQRREREALASVMHSVRAGQAVKAEDIRYLTPESLEGVRAGGDDYLRRLVTQLEREHERDQGWGRER